MKILHDKLMYLRKSRQDDARETVEELLAKHEIQLQEQCEREYGGRIPPENIYRDLGSGESIDARENIKKVLSRLEDPKITGVYVTDPTRLSRGDLDDCDRIIKAFRFSSTLVHTQTGTFDLQIQRERRYFQDALLRGNDYLEFTKEKLWFGRVAAAKRGAYIGRLAPFGYDRVKKGKEWSLEPNGDADVVRLMYKWYVEGLGGGEIARELNARGIKTGTGIKWDRDKVVQLLQNKHYTGMIVYNARQTVQLLEDGQVVKKRCRKTPSEDIIEAKGLHEAIIDMETWEKAQARLSAPKVRHDTTLQNPFAGLIFCAGCGRVMRRQIYKHSADRLCCRSAPHCYKSAPFDDVIAAAVYALEHSELPKLQAKLENGDGDARKIQERMLVKLEKEMEGHLAKLERLHELLEDRTYTPAVFEERRAKLQVKMDACQAAIYQARSTMPDQVDFQEKIVALQDVVALMKDPEASAADQNKFLKTIVDRIEYKGPAPGLAEAGWGVTPFTLEVFLRL